MKIAILGVEPAEQKFFEEKLAGHELQFLDNKNWRELDPATEVLSVFVNFEVTRDVFANLPNLKLIVCRSTGFDNVDLDFAKERGIVVANTPGYGATSVAEFVFGLILNLSRKMNVVRRETRDEEVDRVAERGWDLSGRTIGIVGLGAIGHGVAKIAHGFGMKILAFDNHRDEEFAKQNDIEYTEDLEHLCRESDILTIHAPYRPENHHLIGTKLLEQMKPTALVINTSRGELLNTLQVARMLQAGKLGGAGLDVIEDESYLTNPNAVLELAVNGDELALDKLKNALAMLSLQKMPNVIITNHNAYNTVEALNLINNMVVDNVVNFANGDLDKVFTAK